MGRRKWVRGTSFGYLKVGSSDVGNGRRVKMNVDLDAAKGMFTVIFVISAPLLNSGIYSIPEAARLTGVRSARIRRWLKGYNFKTKTENHHSNPVWESEIEPIEGAHAVGFHDLIEIRFVEAFLKAGVSWKTMRSCHLAAQRELDTRHPFCSNRFVTDGRGILHKKAEAEGDEVLIDLTTNQWEFMRIVEPFFKQLEFDDTTLARWWPLGRERTVVVDPVRNFGQPCAAQAGVPTQVLSQSVKANDGAVDQVAEWYEITPDEVRDAVEFEAGLLKAA